MILYITAFGGFLVPGSASAGASRTLAGSIHTPTGRGHPLEGYCCRGPEYR